MSVNGALRALFAARVARADVGLFIVRTVGWRPVCSGSVMVVLF